MGFVRRLTRVIVIDFVYEVIPASSSLAWANEPRMSQLGQSRRFCDVSLSVRYPQYRT